MSLVWEWDLPANEKLVMLIIADHADDSGANAYPGIARIARRASLSERQVQRILSDLMRRNLIRIDFQRGGGVDVRSDRRPNRYTIIGVTPTSPRDEDGVTFEASRGDMEPVHGVTPMSPNPSIEPSNNKPSSNDLRSWFSQFWDAYPRKVGKREAEAVFGRLMRSKGAPTLEQTLAGVRALRAENRETQFIPYPATWLRQGRWDDETVVAPPVAPEPIQKPFCGECRSGWVYVMQDGVERVRVCDCRL